MEKDESFIIMGALLGILLLIVVALVLIIKPDKEKVYDRDVVKDNTIIEKEEITYSKIDINNRVSYTKDEIKVTFAKEDNAATTLLYENDYALFYLTGYNLGDVRVSTDNFNTTLNAALEEELISIYDAKTALGDSIVEKEKYKLTFGNYTTKTVKIDSYKLHYNDAKRVYIEDEDNSLETIEDALSDDIHKTDLINILRYKAGNGQIDAYKLSDGESYLFETRDNRIFICNTRKNKDIYIGSLNFDYDCK